MSDSNNESETVTFKKAKRRNLRKRCDSSEEVEEVSEEKDTGSTLAEIQERQQLRKRPNGVHIVGLALGKKITIEEEIANKDPFNTKSGGMLNMQALKAGKIKTVDDAYDTGIGTQFSAETNKRDEDEEMMKYIEEQLSQKKGLKTEADMLAENDHSKHKYLSPEEAALLALPAHLRLAATQRSEEMLSNQMLSGIPEVDLGIDTKIRNIEATEEAKQRLIWEQRNKKDGPSHFVPSNMAVNFRQHNKFNRDDLKNNKNKRQMPERTEAVVNPTNQRPNPAKKATDDYHFDKFRKQFKRN